jgi:hypothetical protein
MAWKPKEKKLTPEEALAMAKSELAPFWLGAEPMLAGVRGEDGRATALPLDKSLDQRAWVLLFVDFTQFAGETVLQYAREWARRYAAHELSILLVVRPTYSFMTGAKTLPAFLHKPFESFPVVLDAEGLIASAFGVAYDALPAVKLLHSRKMLFDHHGRDWAKGVEKEIQSFLRIKDPGLPLSPPFAPTSASPSQATSSASPAASAELGARGRSSLIKLEGKFAQEADRVVAQSSSCVIRFKSPSSRVSLVALSTLSAGEGARVRVELGGENVFDAAAGPDLAFGDDGGSEVRVTEGRLYHALQSLPLKSREIGLRFPDADRLPVAIYGIRFAD